MLPCPSVKKPWPVLFFLVFVFFSCRGTEGEKMTEMSGKAGGNGLQRQIIEEKADNLKLRLLQQINRERSARHLRPLAEDSRLSKAAKGHSLDMARNNFFRHQGSDGSTPDKRVRRQGYNWSFVAENLSCGIIDVKKVTRKWMESPGHKKNMLRPLAEHIGIGLVIDEKRKCSPYWTTIFASGDPVR